MVKDFPFNDAVKSNYLRGKARQNKTFKRLATYSLMGKTLSTGYPMGKEYALIGTVFPLKHDSKELIAYCCYCGRKIPSGKAVVQKNGVMCQKCAEEHPSRADDKIVQKK